jgi:uncharacterized phage protein gp47/JayE
MPLPLPDLDTRRWMDLVEEGRSLIPRYAPDWSDHNYHDPGITLIELLAWLIEHDIYRVNRIPERHFRKFLELAGFGPEPPGPAKVPIEFSLVNAVQVQEIPEGVTFASVNPGLPSLAFRTVAPVTVVQASISSLHVFDGHRITEQTRQWRERLPVYLFGTNPEGKEDVAIEDAPAFYIGFDRQLPVETLVSLWIHLAPDGIDWDQREAIITNAREEAVRCVPVRPTATCAPLEPAGDKWDSSGQQYAALEPAVETAELPPHHSVELEWDFFGSGGWTVLDGADGQVFDDTRGMTLDGQVVVKLPNAMEPTTLGIDGQPAFYLRCRLIGGRHDKAPVAHHVSINTVAAEQSRIVQTSFIIRPDAIVPPDGTIISGERVRLLLWFDQDGAIDRIETSDNDEIPDVLVIHFQKAIGQLGRLDITAAVIGSGTGLPEQAVNLPGSPVSRGEVEIWTQTGQQTRRWQRRATLDASRRADAHFRLDSTSGHIYFGTGDRGRVVPSGSTIFARYFETSGSSGNRPVGTAVTLDSRSAGLNQALLGEPPHVVTGRLADVRLVASATGGTDEEDVRHAAGRAAALLWSHERLQEICPSGHCGTLDGLDPELVRTHLAPVRAVTLLDFERLALAVPGTYVRRARAWSNIDPSYPCIEASGTVTVAIVPELPRGRPMPGQQLLDTVARFLEHRRTLGTRVTVTGPEYVEIRVRATVRVKAGVSGVRATDDVAWALDRFLDPLSGGPAGLGWPFGRDVHRSEILEVIDSASGVDHVVSLELSGDPDGNGCGGICVPPTCLVTPGPHEIEVVR